MADTKRTQSRAIPDRQSYLNHRAHAEPVRLSKGVTERRLMVPERHAVRQFSVFEIEIESGATADWPPETPPVEKVWHILGGAGLVTLGSDQFATVPGDIIHIAPGLPHLIQCRGQQTLQLLCIASRIGDQPATAPLTTAT